MCRLPLLVLGLLASAGALAALPLDGARAAPPAAQQRIPLSIGQVSITALSWPFWAAEHIGSFEQQGLALDLSILGSAPTLSTAVVSGSVDVGNAAMDVHIRSVERGADTIYFMTEFGTPIYAVLARPDI